MKKILLLSFILTASSMQAQFWTSKATTFATVSRGINSISIVDANTVWAKAYDGVTTANSVREFTKSSDGGNTWTSGTMSLGIGGASLNISCITASSASTAWVCAYPTGATNGGVWKTIDNGTTWTKQTTALYNNVDSFANVIHFWDANNGFTQGDPANNYFEIYTTTNGGTNWTRVPSANIPTQLLGEYGYVNNYEVYGDIVWFGTNKGRIYKSIDKGLNWTVSQSPISDFGSATVSGHFTFADANKGLLGDNSGALYSTIDGGNTWTLLSYTGVLGTNDIQFIPNTNYVVSIGGAPSYGSSYSLDNGANWTEDTAFDQYTTLKFLNENIGFAGSFSQSATVGGMFKYTGNVFLSANDFTSKSGLKAYPNPTNNTITIQGESLNSISLTDVLGKEVFNSKFASTNEHSLDLSTFSNGIYLLKANNESGNTQTLKVVKN